MKPNPLDKLGYNTTNMRGTVELHWDGPSGLVYDGELVYPLEYKIILRSEWDTRIEVSHFRCLSFLQSNKKCI